MHTDVYPGVSFLWLYHPEQPACILALDHLPDHFAVIAITGAIRSFRAPPFIVDPHMDSTQGNPACCCIDQFSYLAGGFDQRTCCRRFPDRGDRDTKYIPGHSAAGMRRLFHPWSRLKPKEVLVGGGQTHGRESRRLAVCISQQGIAGSDEPGPLPYYSAVPLHWYLYLPMRSRTWDR